MMCTTIRRGEERAVGQRQILCRAVVGIRIIRAGRTRKTAVLIQKISQSFSPRKRDERREREREREKKREKNRHHPITLSLITQRAHSRVITNTTSTKRKEKKRKPKKKNSSSSSSPGSGSSPLGRTMRGANPSSSFFGEKKRESSLFIICEEEFFCVFFFFHTRKKKFPFFQCFPSQTPPPKKQT